MGTCGLDSRRHRAIGGLRLRRSEAETQQSDGGVWERAHTVAKEAANQISLTNVAEIRRMYVAEKMFRKFEAMARVEIHWASVESEKVKQRLKNERYRRIIAGAQALGAIKVPVLPLPESLPDDEPIFAASALEQV